MNAIIVNRGDWLGSRANNKGTNKDAKIYVERSTTLHKLLFTPNTLCMSYVTNTFLLVSSSVLSKQLLCLVQGQGQKLEQWHKTKNFDEFHNHSPLLTMTPLASVKPSPTQLFWWEGAAWVLSINDESHSFPKYNQSVTPTATHLLPPNIFCLMSNTCTCFLLIAATAFCAICRSKNNTNATPLLSLVSLSFRIVTLKTEKGFYYDEIYLKR